MEHLLDNPVWNALCTGNTQFAEGNSEAKYYQKGVAPFAGLKQPDEDSLQMLYKLMPAKAVAVFIMAASLPVIAPRKLLVQDVLWQMVATNNDSIAEVNNDIVQLNKTHVPEMIALTKLTNPGPFAERTIEFGSYSGIIKDGVLAAMAGYRMQPGNYVEVSAICTHPNFAGRGFARALLLAKTAEIIRAGKTPFLHVRRDNTRAIDLYKANGYAVRSDMNLYVLQKDV